MTNEKAIDILKNEWRINSELFGKQFAEALDLAIKALKKRPVEAEWLFVAEAYYDVIYVCTNCGRFFTMPKGEDNDVMTLAPYCHCGAKMIETRYEK